MDVESLAKQLILQNMTPEQQNAVLDSIRTSVSQAKEVQKQRVGENVQVVVQALKKLEADIKARYDETGKAIEKRVATIKDGQNGRNGTDGKAGKDGRSGRDGATGPRGSDGLNGNDGRDGVDGVSVTDAHIDFDGSLIISLSSGRVINVGEVVAPDVAEKIKVITNGGGTSQQVLDTLVSLQNQINAITSAVTYQGTWNASTNTPTLTSSSGTTNGFYIVSVAGSTTLDGTSNWGVGDWAIFNGSIWQRVEGGSSGNFVDLSATGTVTLSGGTANGVTYLNGSKVLTSGTALVFDGTSLGVGITSPTTKLDVNGRARFLQDDTATTGAIILRQNSGDTEGAYIQWVTNDNITQRGWIHIDTSSNMRFATGLSERMRISAAGGLSIGTTTDAGVGGLNITGNAILGDASTDNVQVNGYMGVGGAADDKYGLYVRSSALTGTNQRGIFATPTATSAATSTIVGVYAYPITAAASFTVTNASSFRADDAVKGAASTITNLHGLYIANQTQGTNNYGITSLVTSGTNKYNIYASGTASNYFAGNVGIGVAPPTNPLSVTGNANFSGVIGIGGVTASLTGLYITNTALTGTGQFGIFSTPTGTSAATAIIAAYSATPGTAASAFTSTDVIGFRAANAVRGAGSTITNAHGLYVIDQTNGTNNYGITSLVSSGTNKFNVYASGTAQNYFAGNVGIGTASPTSKLVVSNSSNGTTVDVAVANTYYLAGSIDESVTFQGEFYQNDVAANRAAGYMRVTKTGDFSDNANASANLIFATRNAGSITEKMRIDNAGNLGLGVTPSAWTSTYKAIDVTSRTSFVGTTGGLSIFANNCFFDGTNWIYRVTDAASRYQQDTSAHKWFIAASGTAGNTISFTQAMTLNASGNLGIGTTSPNASALLDVQSTTKGVRMPNMTTIQKNAIASPAAGLMVFDTTLAKLSVYSGTAWETITSI